MRRGAAGLAAGIVMAACGGLAAWQSGATQSAFSYAEPGISPDGGEIAFSSGGRIWSVAAAGGEAHVLVSDGATDRRPLFSPDGREIAFESTRTGGGNIDVLTIATGAIRQATADDGPDALDGWSRDGRWIYFSTSGHDIGPMNDIYRVPAAGGTPMPVTDDRYVNEFQAAPAPDGRRLAFVARGIASDEWWRRGSTHVDRSELWILDLDAPRGASAYRELTPRDARDVWPMWSPDGGAIFYVSDRGSASTSKGGTLGAPAVSGTENIWRHDLASGDDRPITTFHDGRVLWPSITADGRTIAFERGFGVWTADTTSGRTEEVPIARRPDAATSARLRVSDGFSDLSLAPDGRTVAFVAHESLFTAAVPVTGDARLVPTGASRVSQPAWAPDGRSLVYVSHGADGSGIDRIDLATGARDALTSGSARDGSPVVSPDGYRLAFLRDARELHVLDLETRADRILATGTFADVLDAPRPAWSPDGRSVAVFAVGTKAFVNVEIVSMDGGPARQVSSLADTRADDLAWSPDGGSIFFVSRQPTEPGRLVRVDLAPVVTSRHDVDSSETQPSTSVAGSRERPSIAPVGLDVRGLTFTPDGRTAVIAAAVGRETHLYAWPLDQSSRPRLLAAPAGATRDLVVSPDGRDVYYLDDGRVAVASIEGGGLRTLAITAELPASGAGDGASMFEAVWDAVRDAFVDPLFHGVDWARSRGEYGPRLRVAETADERRRLLALMVGDLDSSGFELEAPAGARPSAGRLGVTFDRAAAESSGRLVIQSIVPLGPVALAGGASVGDAIVDVAGEAVGAGVNLDLRLAGTIGRAITLRVAPAGSAPERDVVVRPVDEPAEKLLVYRAWVAANRQYVLEHSGGRLGYVHMRDMTAAAFDALRLDLDVQNHERDGVVIDLRNAGGGTFSADALDIFARQAYLRVSTRLLPASPMRSVAGQRALEAATVLVTNQHTLGDSESFVEGYRALKLGSIVGEPTAGWDVYTREVLLVDGTVVHLPVMRVRTLEGVDLDGHPRPVDVEVTRPLGEDLEGRDTQLDAAIRVLLARIGRAE